MTTDNRPDITLGVQKRKENPVLDRKIGKGFGCLATLSFQLLQYDTFWQMQPLCYQYLKYLLSFDNNLSIRFLWIPAPHKEGFMS